MLTERQSSQRLRETNVAVVVEPPAPRHHARWHAVRVAPFFVVLVQFGLVALVVNYWQLESQSLARLMWLALVGFVIHHLLPQRFRLWFFVILSLVAVVGAVGHLGPSVARGWLVGKTTTTAFLYHLFPGLTLIAIGAGLIGLCHLPIRFGVRAALVIIAG